MLNLCVLQQLSLSLRKRLLIKDLILRSAATRQSFATKNSMACISIARTWSLGQGNVFTPVCLSAGVCMKAVCGGVCMEGGTFAEGKCGRGPWMAAWVWQRGHGRMHVCMGACMMGHVWHRGVHRRGHLCGRDAGACVARACKVVGGVGEAENAGLQAGVTHPTGMLFLCHVKAIFSIQEIKKVH